MTLGITPTRPETGYGYLQCGGVRSATARSMAVEEFKEKPSYDVAEGYVKSGSYLWNAGMFVWRVDVFLAELARQQPQLAAGISRIAQAWDSPDREEVLGEVWPTLPAHLGRLRRDGGRGRGRPGRRPCPATSAGTTSATSTPSARCSTADPQGNVVVGRDAESKPGVLLRETENLVVVPTSGRLVAALGRPRPDHRRHPGRRAGLPAGPGAGGQVAGRRAQGPGRARVHLRPAARGDRIYGRRPSAGGICRLVDGASGVGRSIGENQASAADSALIRSTRARRRSGSGSGRRSATTVRRVRRGAAEQRTGWMSTSIGSGSRVSEAMPDSSVASRERRRGHAPVGRLAVTAQLHPHLHPAVQAEQHPAVGVDDQGAGRHVAGAMRPGHRRRAGREQLQGPLARQVRLR